MSVSNEIIKVFDALAEKLGMVIDWSSENIIPYLEQLCDKYINYEIATSVVWIVFGVFLISSCKWGIKIAQSCEAKSKEDEWSEWDMADICVRVGTIIAVVSGITVVITQLFDIVTCLTFPEKIILDEVKSVINNKWSC